MSLQSKIVDNFPSYDVIISYGSRKLCASHLEFDEDIVTDFITPHERSPLVPFFLIAKVSDLIQSEAIRRKMSFKHYVVLSDRQTRNLEHIYLYHNYDDHMDHTSDCPVLTKTYKPNNQ